MRSMLMYPQNLHTHTTFFDGIDDCESIVAQALKIGFTGIGFSEHSHMSYSKNNTAMTPEKDLLYQKEVARLKEKYQDQIHVVCGLEFDQYSDHDLTGYDYVIGTNHCLKYCNEFLTFDRDKQTVKGIIDNYFDGDGLRFAKEYYAQLAQLPQYGNFDIVGHFDILTKHCEKYPFLDETDERYQKYALDCFYALKEKISIFEINTGAMARGYRTTPYPHPVLLREMAKAGVGFTLSSDCHNKELLAYRFPEMIELCKACGVKELQILTKGGFKGISLE